MVKHGLLHGLFLENKKLIELWYAYAFIYMLSSVSGRSQSWDPAVCFRRHPKLDNAYGVFTFHDFFPIFDLIFSQKFGLPGTQQKMLQSLYPKLKASANTGFNIYDWPVYWDATWLVRVVRRWRLLGVHICNSCMWHNCVLCAVYFFFFSSPFKFFYTPTVITI